MKINKLLETKQFQNSLKQLRDTLNKRGYDIEINAIDWVWFKIIEKKD